MTDEQAQQLKGLHYLRLFLPPETFADHQSLSGSEIFDRNIKLLRTNPDEALSIAVGFPVQLNELEPELRDHLQCHIRMAIARMSHR